MSHNSCKILPDSPAWIRQVPRHENDSFKKAQSGDSIIAPSGMPQKTVAFPKTLFLSIQL